MTHFNKPQKGLAVFSMVLLMFGARAQTSTKPVTEKGWIERSNQYTKMLLDISKKYAPEAASAQGLAAYDTLVSIPTLANILAEQKDKQAALLLLAAAKKQEPNRLVKQDIDILINQTNLSLRQQHFEMNQKVVYLNGTAEVFQGLQILLDDQTPVERRAAAIIRLRKYTGAQNGYSPLVDILKLRTQQQLNTAVGKIFPSKEQLEVDLSRNTIMVTGIEQLFKKFKLSGWEQDYATIKSQLEAYDAWIRVNLLPKARPDFGLPVAEYQLRLEGYGIDITPVALATIAHAAFTDIQNQMQPLAEAIAKKYNLPSADYRAVIAFLKKNQLTGDSIMPLYHQHLQDIEAIIRNQQLLTLPERAAIIRLSTTAETAQSPAPHMVPPPFLHNTGQRGVFVLPLNMPPAPGEQEDRYDDFTYEAASWTIIAHEARPGHELQFDKMVEEGVSQARSLFAFNSTNVEGWGLYSEYITRPFMPIEGQLISLDFRLLRSARAFLDPELQSGKTTPEKALQLLMKEVVLSHAFAKQEVERYTIKSPGQANSYFYGYTKMLALRKDTEALLGNKFNALQFHDFILSQGILPPALIREAVMTVFVPAAKG